MKSIFEEKLEELRNKYFTVNEQFSDQQVDGIPMNQTDKREIEELKNIDKEVRKKKLEMKKKELETIKKKEQEQKQNGSAI